METVYTVTIKGKETTPARLVYLGAPRKEREVLEATATGPSPAVAFRNAMQIIREAGGQ